MYTPTFTIGPGLLTDVEQIGRILGFIQAVQLPGIYARELLAAVEAETVHASTAIEGNTLTQEQVTQVLAGLLDALAGVLRGWSAGGSEESGEPHPHLFGCN